MEAKKIFNVRDNFFIAEALDAIANGLPVPLHVQKEFEAQPDMFVIWQKLFLLSSIISPSNILIGAFPLTPAQIKTLNSIPVLAIVAPGANKAIQVISASARLVFGTVAYTSSALRLYTNSLANPQFDVPFFLNSVVSNIEIMSEQSIANNIVENAPLFISANADSLVGDSPVNVYVIYRIINL